MIDATQIRSTRHHPAEDAQGILFGSAMAAFGILMLTHLGFITGQTAGLAVLISYVTGLPFGLVWCSSGSTSPSSGWATGAWGWPSR